MLGDAQVRSMKYLVPPIMVLAVADSFLKEISFVPSAVKPISFFVLGPLIAAGVILLLPFSRRRIELITPRRMSKLVLGAAVGISSFQVGAWAFMFYQASWLGHGTINATALFLKDVILVSSAALFGVLMIRLLRWYGRTRNLVVLLFGVGSFGFALFAALHVLPDFISTSVPRIIPDALAISFLIHTWGYWPAMWLMIHAYYGVKWRRYLPPILAAPLFESAYLVVRRIGISLDPSLLTVINLGLIFSPLVYLWGIFILVPAIANPTGQDYYRTMGYSFGMTAAANCGMGLSLLTAFPLSGFPSLSMLLPAAALSFAGFTSTAAYYSISDDLRLQIRRSAGFIASIGEAESIISTERQVSEFYNRFTGLARESGAVEASSITKDEIFSYATAVKRIQKSRSERQCRPSN